MRRRGYINNSSRSFLTSERLDDSNATPPKTISLFGASTEIGITVPGAGAGTDETPVDDVDDWSTANESVAISVFEAAAGRVYLFAGL